MNLSNFLNKNENARKIFGKRELKIIEKQILGISLTQSEKNRLSRDIRKKFEFISEISKHDFDFRLKKGCLIKEIVEETKKSIINSQYSKRIKRITLFGSTIDNQRTFRSDIDISVEFNKIDLKEATEFKIKFSNDSIDIEVYNFLPDKIKKEINKKGKVIYEREN